MSEVTTPYADTRDMYTVHIMFRREYALMPGLVRSVPPKDTDRARVVAAYIELVNLILHHHHAGEDEVLWPRLLTRAPKEIDPVVHLVEGHHRGIEGLLAETEARLGAWTDGASGEDGESLAQTLQRLAVALYEHMGLEERLILPLVERHIFASEWHEIVEHAAEGVPREIAPVVAGMVMYEGGPHAVPEQMRTVLAEVAPPAYAAHCERVHGTPAPPRAADVVIGTPFVGVPGFLS
jgi:iron-sulfur cluster repair protein YtfE (RIC family)